MLVELMVDDEVQKWLDVKNVELSPVKTSISVTHEDESKDVVFTGIVSTDMLGVAKNYFIEHPESFRGVDFSLLEGGHRLIVIGDDTYFVTGDVAPYHNGYFNLSVVSYDRYLKNVRTFYKIYYSLGLHKMEMS